MEEGRGALAGFRPRQSSYLRISPTLVLQLILYLEPHHVEWMNVSVFERMLIALKDRIPLKLQQDEIRGKRSGNKREKVEIFRGADYQMAFFFRKTNDKHVVLLKDKHLHYTTTSVPRSYRQVEPSPRPRQTPTPTPALPPHVSSSSSSSRQIPRRRSNSPPVNNNDDDDDDNFLPPPPPHPHTKPIENAHDPPSNTTTNGDGVDGTATRGKKRRLPRGSDDSGMPLTLSEEEDNDDSIVEDGEGSGSKRRRQEEEVIVVKDEPEEEIPLMKLSEATGPVEYVGEGARATGALFRPEVEEEEGTPGFEGRRDGEEEDEMKEEIDQDIKPQLKVNYQKFTIFDRSLVVIVEPYPALPRSSSTTPVPSFMNTEIRQLSASVQPQQQQPSSSYRNGRSESVFSRASSLSVTPAPTGGSTRRGGSTGGGGSLFRRSETTPLMDDDRDVYQNGSETPEPTTMEKGKRKRRVGGGDDEEEEEDEQMRGFREMSEIFAGAEDFAKDQNEVEDDDEDDLPSVEEMMERRKRKVG